MDHRDIVQILFGIVIAIIGGLIKEMWSRHMKLVDTVTELERRLPDKFASRDDLNSVKDAIDKSETTILSRFSDNQNTLNKTLDRFEETLQQLWSKLDRKVDKKEH